MIQWRKNRQTALPSNPVEYPKGTFVEVNGEFFYIAGPGKRYRITSERILNSYAPHRVVKTSADALQNYRVAGRMKFRTGSLIYNIADGKIFLIEDGLRRHVTSPDALARIGASERDVVVVSKQETELHKRGEDFN